MRALQGDDEMQAQFSLYTVTGNDSVYTGTSTQLAELDVQHTKTLIWRPGGTDGGSAWTGVHHDSQHINVENPIPGSFNGERFYGPAGPCSYFPHKVLRLINFIASPCVSRYPCSAAHTHKRNTS